MTTVKNIVKGGDAPLLIPNVVNNKPEWVQRLHSLASRCLDSLSETLIKPRVWIGFLGVCGMVLSVVNLLEELKVLPSSKSSSTVDWFATNPTHPLWVRVATLVSKMGIALSTHVLAMLLGMTIANKKVDQQVKKMDADVSRLSSSLKRIAHLNDEQNAIDVMKFAAHPPVNGVTIAAD